MPSVKSVVDNALMLGGKAFDALKGIRAWHGSPHDFDKFDLSKIGSGEGAQVYGHGLYFAENPSVAREYRERLSKGQPTTFKGRPISYFSDAPEDVAAGYLARAQRDKSSALSSLERDIGAQSWETNADKLRAAREALLVMSPDEVKQPGRLYEVLLRAEPAQFLDWDAPFKRQPKIAQDALIDAGALAKSRGVPDADAPLLPLKAHATGQSAYESLTLNQGRSPEWVSAVLNEAGVPGIKYLDQGSRAAGEGSHNYVVFNDEIIDILKKYGIAAPAAAPVAQGLYKDGGS